jgi:hypothetical protein
MGLEGIVSKGLDSRYRSGRSPDRLIVLSHGFDDTYLTGAATEAPTMRPTGRLLQGH